MGSTRGLYKRENRIMVKGGERPTGLSREEEGVIPVAKPSTYKSKETGKEIYGL